MEQSWLAQLENHSLGTLQQADQFVDRHIGPDQEEREAMLQTLGFASLQDMLHEIVPASIRRTEEMQLASGLTEHQVLHKLKQIASKNKVLKSFIGMGYHNTLTPPTIQRNILENPAW